MKRLIITADDFGLSHGVNQAVAEAHKAGTLTSASLMANMEGFTEAVALMSTLPNLDVGLHFVLAAGSPVSAAAQIRSLVDASGRFLSRGRLLRRTLAGRVRRQDVERELDAQLAVLRSAGIAPSFINGDQHIHVLPTVRDVVVARAAELKVAVRVPNETALWMLQASPARSWALLVARLATKNSLALLSRAFAKRCQEAGVATNQTFVSPFGILPQARFDTPAMVRVLAGVRDGLNEMMVHPAHADAETAQFWKGGETQAVEREEELRSLLDPTFANALESHHAVLTTYREATIGRA